MVVRRRGRGTTSPASSSSQHSSALALLSQSQPPRRRSARARGALRQRSPDPFPSVPPPSAAAEHPGFPSPVLSAARKRRKVLRSPVPVTPDGSLSAAMSTPLVRSDDDDDDNNNDDDNNDDDTFIDLQVPPCELRPSATLTTGQCFHWKALSVGPPVDVPVPKTTAGASSSAWGTHDATEWIGTLRSEGRSVVVRLRETSESTLYRVLHPPPPSSSSSSSSSSERHEDNVDVRALLRSYFQLSVPLEPLYGRWSEACPRLARIAKCIPGVRVVDQDPWECLVSFICSSNNNIPRITKMLEAIRAEYGDPILTFQGRTLYSFPSLETMKRRSSEEGLRDKCGLGYRAKYLLETIRILDDMGGEEYLRGLRSVQDPRQVQNELLKLRGVGRKVADCVALFSLQQTNAIPVDVHVWQIARRDYSNDDSGDPDRRLPDNVKSLTPAVYEKVGGLFRERFGSHGGWAHSLLFVAELPSFRPALPPDMVEEMDRFRRDEKARKAKS